MKLSLAQLKALVSAYVDEQKISVASFVETRDNTVGLLDKIGKIVTLDTSYIDKLTMLEGEYLSYGKTIEEWQEDLKLPENFDASGSTTLAPHDGTYRPVFYSYTLGEKTFPCTIRNNDIERAVHFIEQFESIITMKSKRLYDSEAVWRYQVKREMLGKLAEMCADVKTDASSFSTSTAYSVGDLVKSGSPTQYGIVVKPISANEYGSWALAIAGGAVIIYDLETSIAVPVDASTGEAFIEQVKKDVEIARDISEGHSLNGNTLGASESGLILFVKQGVVPSLEVNVLASAFHEGRVASPAQVVVIKDFGSASSSDVFAILMDARGCRLHNTYRAVRDQVNGQGDFLNMYLHTENTAFISRNTFVKVYKPA